MALVLITHDLGVVAGVCDRILVMYAGEVVESGTVEQIYNQPCHPYTQGLLHSVPRLDCESGFELHAIPGNPPSLMELPAGCVFRDRCEKAFEACVDKPPLHDIGDNRLCRCHLEQPQ
jgi:oligopeptide transport system ATP-binding protein